MKANTHKSKNIELSTGPGTRHILFVKSHSILSDTGCNVRNRMCRVPEQIYLMTAAVQQQDVVLYAPVSSLYFTHATTHITYDK